MEKFQEREVELRPIVERELYTGIDFDFDEEVVDIIADTLKDCELYDEDLLLCGYALTEHSDSRQRTDIFAHTFAEFRYHQEYGPTDPLQNALELAAEEGGVPSISVYDGSLMHQDAHLSEKYHIRGYSDISQAHVARFIIR